MANYRLYKPETEGVIKFPAYIETGFSGHECVTFCERLIDCSYEKIYLMIPAELEPGEIYTTDGNGNESIHSFTARYFQDYDRAYLPIYTVGNKDYAYYDYVIDDKRIRVRMEILK